MKSLSYLGAALLGWLPLNAQFLINPYRYAAGGGMSYVLKDSNTGTSTGSYTVTFGSGSRIVAGSFQASATYTIARVDVALEIVGAPNRDITMEVWSTSGTTPSAIVASGVASAAVNTTTFPATEDWVSFFPSAAVSSGTTYHILLIGTSSNSSNYFRWHRTSGSFRCDQTTNPVGTWTNNSTSVQLKFRAYSYE